MVGSFRPPRAARSASAYRAPRPPKDAPPAPPIPRAETFGRDDLRSWSDPPPGWTGPLTEWVVWEDLVRRGWKIYGRAEVKGRTLNYAEADAAFQPAIPVAGLNLVKDFFRADFLIIPGRRGPSPGPPYGRGIILDPVTDWTHRNAGTDRLRRGILAQAGYLLVWIDAEAGGPLFTRTREVITAALYGGDDSAIDRGTR